MPTTIKQYSTHTHQHGHGHGHAEFMSVNARNESKCSIAAHEHSVQALPGTAQMVNQRQIPTTICVVCRFYCAPNPNVDPMKHMLRSLFSTAHTHTHSPISHVTVNKWRLLHVINCHFIISIPFTLRPSLSCIHHSVPVFV